MQQSHAGQHALPSHVTGDADLAAAAAAARKTRNWKLIVDPLLQKGSGQKVYRTEGIVAGVGAMFASPCPSRACLRSPLFSRRRVSIPL